VLELREAVEAVSFLKKSSQKVLQAFKKLAKTLLEKVVKRKASK
jgi:hypothetical protein